ncbi:potassium transporter Kup [Sphingomonas sp. SUN039]|uniref:potassium transporter Kup n=1 Tax=Sphingomonas sp. SUN039 TaxID=2937787 RepID=UPI00216480E9|nr:potassium transporter Kup [Sphingomonas sp. SUN039]UVO53026.1 potassium transporter Kup [Sphingomonas sp. SUN039]
MENTKTLPPAAESATDSHSPQGSTSALTLGALGVVFGDIGTSPLYALQATLDPRYHLGVNVTDLYGIVSLIFWSFVFVVTVKYVFIVMRCDNHGEGGSLALYALIKRMLGAAAPKGWLLIFALFATALFYADAMLTPAISVISAVEGLGVVSSAFQPYIVWIALSILIGLFAIQRHGTHRVGRFFGPVMLVYFATIAAMGVVHIVDYPQVLGALSPVHLWGFFAAHPFYSFLSLGAVVYAVTGAEALYADMGHFGRKPITLAWLSIAMPALMLNYMGQAAMLLRNPAFADNPFFHMVPPSLTIPLLVIATLATIIASQAVISGAFSVTQQAIQLGFIPRMQILHTSSQAKGQIYLPVINWALATMVALLVVTFQHSAAMLPAYGLAVVGTMLITTLMQYIVVFRIWRAPLWRGAIGFATFITVDLLFLASGFAKLFEGAWFPILMGLVIFTLLTTWAKGRRIMRDRLDEGAMPLSAFIASAAESVHRVRGTSVFMSATPDSIPAALLHNLKHNQVLHERIILLTVQVAGVPHVEPDARSEVTVLGDGFFRVVLRYGFMEEIDIPRDLAGISTCGEPFNMMATSFFLGRQKLIASKQRPGMALWREQLFAWMSKNSESAMEFFKLPTNRVVELGSQVQI